MPRYDLPAPLAIRLPQPPDVYDPSYMRRLIAALEDQLRQLNQSRQVLASGIMLTSMPTVADLSTLKPGEVYLDGGFLKVAP